MEDASYREEMDKYNKELGELISPIWEKEYIASG